MSSKRITLNLCAQATTPFHIDDDLVTQRVSILGRTGSGKTYTAAVLVEELLGIGAQVVVVDPLDVWWGIRSSADGKRDGFPVVIFGGDHEDIPLREEDAKVIADAIVDHADARTRVPVAVEAGERDAHEGGYVMSAKHTTDKGIDAFRSFKENCPHRIEVELERRPCNGLNVEIGAPCDRCALKTPRHWPEGATAARWILSGGSAIVLGLCSRRCALGHEWCPECGHRKESHFLLKDCGCSVVQFGDRFPCACTYYTTRTKAVQY